MKIPLRILLFLICLFPLAAEVSGQIIIRGTVKDSDGAPMYGVIVHVEGIVESQTTNAKGNYKFVGLSVGPKKLTFFQPGFKKVEQTVDPKNGTHRVNVTLEPLSQEFDAVTVSEKRDETMVMTTLRPVDGVAIYSSKKTEVINVELMTANLAANRARQVFSQVAGLNIWESDCAGIQIGVGGRGLSPSRMENFNTRQNGYDIAADALGYPESYYAPPMQAVKKIEVIRGAASLQYGPQFGGMINFVMKEGAKDKKFEAEAAQTVGAYGFYNSYTSIGGTIGRFNYYTSFQYRFGNCWRCNSEFDNYNVYAALKYTSKKGTTVKLDYTRMWYLTRQAGGLTDAQFEQDAQQSFRERNWFRVNWNLMSISAKHEFSSRSKLDLRVFGLLASREALGFLGPPNLADLAFSPSAEERDRYRDLIYGRFRNIGGEARYLYQYQIKNQLQSFLTGVRLYRGFTTNQQGPADSTSAAVFEFRDVDVNSSASDHPSLNVAWFAEHVFKITKKVSVTPGIRVEYIRTETEGQARTVQYDLPGNVIYDTTRTGQNVRSRWFPLFGLGASYKPLKGVEVYSNFSQNYKPINFTDLWVSNPSFRIDPSMEDETGFNLDLGLRGNIKDWFQFDVTGFMMLYNNRIGYIQAVDPELSSVYRLRTNVSNARTVGVETFLRWNAIKTFMVESDWRFAMFSNVTWLDARYTSSEESAFRNNRVELTPDLLVRVGVDFGWKDIQLSYLASFTSQQFTDATNSISTPNGVNGIIPSYYVMDLNLSYKFWKMKFTGGIENITDNRYFTRRATGYPGPGIIPSSGRTFFLTLSIKV
jgi:Fe(3+) dicitrate transport protein